MDQQAKRKKTLPLRFKDLKIDNKIEIANNIDKSEKINDNSITSIYLYYLEILGGMYSRLPSRYTYYTL